jgi:hypothetical protein
MTSAFKISQVLYIDKTRVSELLANESSLAIEIAGNDAKIMLAASEDQTINDQYKLYVNLLDRLLKLVNRDGNGEIVLSVCIRAYDYVPEINFSNELLAKIAQIGASIDVDLINMIERGD